MQNHVYSCIKAAYYIQHHGVVPTLLSCERMPATCSCGATTSRFGIRGIIVRTCFCGYDSAQTTARRAWTISGLSHQMERNSNRRAVLCNGNSIHGTLPEHEATCGSRRHQHRKPHRQPGFTCSRGQGSSTFGVSRISDRTASSIKAFQRDRKQTRRSRTSTAIWHKRFTASCWQQRQRQT